MKKIDDFLKEIGIYCTPETAKEFSEYLSRAYFVYSGMIREIECETLSINKQHTDIQDILYELGMFFAGGANNKDFICKVLNQEEK